MKLTLKKFLLRKGIWDEYLETCTNNYKRKLECIQKEKMYDLILERIENGEKKLDITIELGITRQCLDSAMRSAKIRKYEKSLIK